MTRVGVGLLLLGLTLLILRPFVVPVIWATVVAYMTWGIYQRACRLTGRPKLTAALFALAIVLLFGIPALYLLVALAEQSAALVKNAQEWIQAGAPLPAWISEWRWVGPRLTELRHQILTDAGELGPDLVQLGRSASKRILTLATGAAQDLFSFFVTVITVYVLYVDGERIAAQARRILFHVFPERPREFVDHVTATVRAVVIAIVGTAVIQGTVQGLGLALFGVPSPVALGALTVLLSFVPGGPVLVWGGAAAWLFSQGHTASAVGTVVWGVVVVGSIDNLMRPILIKRSGSVEIPFLLILFGVLGGLGAFGLLGLLIGPVLLAVVFMLLTELPPGGPEPAPTGSWDGRSGDDA